MQRITISVDDDLAQQFEELVRTRGYQNRSEAFRDLVRRELEEQRIKTHHAPNCVANLSYVYDHNERQLARRLATKSHGHHDLSHSTMHVHLVRIQFRPYGAAPGEARLEDYRRITEAVLAGDPVQAESATRGHVQNIRDRILRLPDEAFAPEG